MDGGSSPALLLRSLTFKTRMTWRNFADLDPVCLLKTLRAVPLYSQGLEEPGNPPFPVLCVPHKRYASRCRQEVLRKGQGSTVTEQGFGDRGLMGGGFEVDVVRREDGFIEKVNMKVSPVNVSYSAQSPCIVSLPPLPPFSTLNHCAFFYKT